MYVHIYVNIYVHIVCMCVCASRATVQYKYGKKICHLKKRLLCSLVRKSRQYSQLLSLSACLYIHRHAYLLGLRRFICKDSKLLELGSLSMSSKTPEEEEAVAAVRVDSSSCLGSCSSSTPALLEGSNTSSLTEP